MLQRIRTHQRISAALLLCLFVGACVTHRELSAKKHRGITFSHAQHAEEEIDCSDCHETEDAASLPDHDTCSVCHEIDEEPKDPEQCALCHSDAEQKVEPFVKRLTEELKFSHATHAEAEISCEQCHPNPDTRRLPKGALKPFCIDCHEQTRPELIECAVCHTEINKETRPTHRGVSRIAHDSPQIWAHSHGREWRMDSKYCAICHEDETFCSDCHQKEAPQNHSISWRRRTHGLRASWDRSKCTVCHEEDSCIKCHSNTKPSSHRGSWSGRLNRHCVSCHFPADRSNCTLCHQSIEHRQAKMSPHRVRVYPTRCGICHPGGNPLRAPHPLNSTIGCRGCH